MKLTFERKLPLILFIVFLTLVAVGFVSYQYTVSLQDAAARKSISQSILLNIDRTLAEMLDADYFAQEFYTLGNTTYESRYLDRKRQAMTTVAALRGATGSNPVQAANSASACRPCSQRIASYSRLKAWPATCGWWCSTWW